MTSLELRDRDLPSTEVLGVPVHRITMEETLRVIESFIAEGTPRLIVTADASGLALAGRDSEWKELLRSAALVTPDSSGVKWAMRRKGARLPDRVSGCDLVAELCRLSAEKGYRLFFLGAAPGIAEKAAERLRARYPGCRIVGTEHGYFGADEDQAVAERVRAARPDILLVAMGMPKQEKWIAAHMGTLQVPVSIGVGGTFDVYAGTAPRAPRTVQRLGMEWLWRLALNPRKIRKVLSLPRFVLLVLKDK